MEGRAICIVFFTSVLISTLGPANGKPFFGPLWCEMMCEDDGTGTTASTTDFFDLLFDPCIACPDTNTTTVLPTNPTPPQPPMNFMLAPTAAGMNLTMEMKDGRWVISVLPSPASNQAASPNTATTTAAPTTTAASTTSGSTTAAPTTTAAGSTTAGTTTAATTTTKKA